MPDGKLIDRGTDLFYDKMLDDYRVNRFFNGRPRDEQSTPLKTLLKTVLSGAKGEECTELLDDYFMAVFARNNSKRSLVMGNDFMFLLDIVGGEKAQPITPLCDPHSHLLKLGVDDSHYDVVMEHLSTTLNEIGITTDLKNQLLAMAERMRDGLLGRQAAVV